MLNLEKLLKIKESLKKYAKLIEEIGAKEIIVTEEVVKKLLLWFTINFFFCPSAYIYKAYLVRTLIKREIFLSSLN